MAAASASAEAGVKAADAARVALPPSLVGREGGVAAATAVAAAAAAVAAALPAGSAREAAWRQAVQEDSVRVRVRANPNPNPNPNPDPGRSARRTIGSGAAQLSE